MGTPGVPVEVRWSTSREVADAPILSEEDKHTLKQKQAALDKLLADEQKAKYKIEILFGHKRTLHGLSTGALSIWESGTMLHGGGDTKVYMCPAKNKPCKGLIAESSQGFGHLVCPECGSVWEGEDVYGELIFKLPNNKWAEVLMRFYTLLGHNADIYLKYPKHDLRVASGLEQAKQLHGEALDKARKERQQYIYPLKNIIKDTANGADLQGRFYALLTA